MIELLTNAEMAEADRLTIAGGVPGIELMESAGAAVADAVVRGMPERHAGRRRRRAGQQWRRRFCRRAAARRARLRGPVCWSASGSGSRAMRRAPRALDAARSMPASARSDLAGADVIVDALFGAGLDRPVEGMPRAMIEAMNAAGAPVFAVDLPSGINGTTGAVMGAAVKAAADRHVLSQEARPSAAAGAAALRADRRSPTSEFRRACSTTSGPKTFAPTRRQLWVAHFPVPRLSGHKYHARPCGRASPAAFDRPARRGSRRAARCGPAPGLSRSRARARRWRSMRQRVWRSWCGRSMAPSELREFLADRAAQRGRARPRRGRRARQCVTGAGGARRRSAPWCSMPMR